MKLEWHNTPDTSPEVPIERRDKWVEEVMKRVVVEPESFFFNISGRSMVIAVKYDDGAREVFDCVLKRRAVVEP